MHPYVAYLNQFRKSAFLAPQNSVYVWTKGRNGGEKSPFSRKYQDRCGRDVNSLRSKRFRAVSRVKGRAKNGPLPLPLPPLSFFGSRFISRAAKTEYPVPRSFFAPKQHGNACYAG